MTQKNCEPTLLDIILENHNEINNGLYSSIPKYEPIKFQFDFHHKVPPINNICKVIIYNKSYLDIIEQQKYPNFTCVHSIHPDFLHDQITRSLERLNVDTIDVYLLHNPEYFLQWAVKDNMPEDEARDMYDDRIRRAFAHLEKEVAKGSVQCTSAMTIRPHFTKNVCVRKMDPPCFWQARVGFVGAIKKPRQLLEVGRSSV